MTRVLAIGSPDSWHPGSPEWIRIAGNMWVAPLGTTIPEDDLEPAVFLGERWVDLPGTPTDEQVTEDELDGEWKVRYWRHGKRDVEPEETLQYALGFCAAGSEYGSHSAEALISPAGEVIEGAKFDGLVAAYEMGQRQLDEWLAKNWPEGAAQQQAAESERLAKMAANKAAVTKGLAEFEEETGVDLTRYGTVSASGVTLDGYGLRSVVREMIVEKSLLR
jgi:hypothetical protein